MAWPTTDPDELARRLGLPTPTADPTTPLLGSALGVAATLVGAHTDEDTATALPATYLEAVYQLAVKVWDTGTKGMVDATLADFTMPAPAATPGLVRAVWAFILPLHPTGGVTV